MDSHEELVDRWVRRPAHPPETRAQRWRRWARSAAAKWPWLIALLVLAVGVRLYLDWAPVQRQRTSPEDSRVCSLERAAVGYPDRRNNWIRAPGLSARVHQLDDDAHRSGASSALKTMISRLVAAYDEGDVEEMRRRAEAIGVFCGTVPD